MVDYHGKCNQYDSGDLQIVLQQYEESLNINKGKIKSNLTLFQQNIINNYTAGILHKC